VAASHIHVPWGPRTVVGAAHIWQFQDEAARPFLASDPRSLTVKYEDLIGDTEAQVRRICDFIGIPFEHQMLDQGITPDVDPRTWRTSVIVDPARLTAWQAQLTPLDQARVATICADGMRRHGYHGGLPSRRTVMVVPYDMALGNARELLQGAADRGITLRRLRRARKRTESSPILFYGARRTLRWEAQGVRTFRAVVRWLAAMVAWRLRGRTLVWVAGPTSRMPVHSRIERAGDAILTLTVRKTSLGHALEKIVRSDATPV
jgi:hypothetical protein